MRNELNILVVQSGMPDIHVALAAEHCRIAETLSLSDDLAVALDEHQPDALVLDIKSTNTNILNELKRIQSIHPLPVIIFSQDDAQDSIQSAIDAGVSAYVVDSLTCGRVTPILNAAIARHQQIQQLKGEITNLKDQLESRKVIEKAKGILMNSQQLTESEAYQRLRQQAMNNNLSLLKVSKALIISAQLLDA